MQLSELLGLDVLDATAQRVGTVVDVRLAVDGNLDDKPDSPVLFGLVVNPRTRLSYLGYETLRRPSTRPCCRHCCAGATAAPS